MKRNFRLDSLTFRGFTRSLCFTGLIASALSASHAASATTNDPYGVWLRPEGGVQFRFYDCDGRLCAKVVAAQNPEDRAAIGTVILRGAAKIGPNEWKGKLFNSEDGKTYDGFITVKSPTELTLKGCLWGVLCSDETWKRVSPTHAMLAP